MTEAEKAARKLGSAQKRAILALSGEWGASSEYRACIRLWFRDDIPMLLDHRYLADDCWKLRPLGLEVRAILLKEESLVDPYVKVAEDVLKEALGRFLGYDYRPDTIRRGADVLRSAIERGEIK